MPIAKSFPMEAYIQAKRYQMEQNARPKDWQTALSGIANDYGQAYKQKQEIELKTAVEDRLLRQKTQSEALTKLFTDPNYEIKDAQGNIVPIDQRINIIPTVQQTGKMPAGFNVTLKPQRPYEKEEDRMRARMKLGQDPRSLKQMEIDAGKYTKTTGSEGLKTDKAIYENYNKLVDNELASKKHYDSLMNAGLGEGDLRVLQAQRMYLSAQKDRLTMFNKHKDILSNTPQGQAAGTPQPTQTVVTTPQDKAALDWALNNPQDPRSQAILIKLKSKQK